MTRKNGDIVAERKEFRFDSGKKQIGIASGQIPAANSAGKQDIAADEQFFVAQKKAETAR